MKEVQKPNETLSARDKLHESVTKFNELIAHIPEEKRAAVAEIAVNRITSEIDSFIKRGKLIADVTKAVNDNNEKEEKETLTTLVGNVIDNELKAIGRTYTAKGETMPGFFTDVFKDTRVAIIDHINHTILKETKFLLVCTKTLVTRSVVEGIDLRVCYVDTKTKSYHQLELINKDTDITYDDPWSQHDKETKKTKTSKKK